MDKLYLVILIILYLLINNYYIQENFTLDDIVPVKNIINYGKDSIDKIKTYFNLEDKKNDDTSECRYIKGDNYDINYDYDISAYDKNNNFYFNNI